MTSPLVLRRLSRFALVTACSLGLAVSVPALESELVFDVSPLNPDAVGGELIGVSTSAGHVVHARLDATFVSADPGPWTLGVSFGLPTGIAGVDSQTLGWAGVGSFSTSLQTDAFNGVLGPPPGQSHFTWFVEWSGGTPFMLPGGGFGVKPVQGVFTQLVLTLTLSDSPPGAWTDLGHATSGALGEPHLAGTGNLCRSAPGSLVLSSARPGGSAFLVVGFSSLWHPFHGGLLIPAPDLVLAPLPIDAAGGHTLPFSFPIGVPEGLQLWFQDWIPDPAGPSGYASSNALLATVPSDC